ncbi:8-amino-7-oxononanoate synthase [Ammoniphilus sp. CFH 90114]|nr:8-amino-7-oxononanoate synthase [Ammoniphilus sp. CFH 90114]
MLDHLIQELDVREQKGLTRRLRRMDEIKEKGAILFSSNNYLGLAEDAEMKACAAEAILRFGTGSTGSRLTTGNSTLHEELEQQLASFKGKEAAILFSSGYLANIGTISALMGKDDVIFSDSLNHASIIDGCRLSRAETIIYKHVDMEDLEKKLKENPAARHKLIVTDGVFSMDGNIAPLPRIVEIAEAYGAWVMVDDAHATGVLGSNGAGTAEHFGLTNRVHLCMGTMSKSIGAEGGYVAADHVFIEYLRNNARSFIFQTALSPGVIAAASAGIRLIQQQPWRREKLIEQASLFRQGLKKLGFELVEGTTPIIAVVIGDAQQAVDFSKRLEEAGLFAPAIRPPTVPIGTSRIRVTLTASHQAQDLDFALHCFENIGKEMRFIP